MLQQQFKSITLRYQRTSHKTRKSDIAAGQEVVHLNSSVIQQPEKDRQKT
jgi:hypothetical protein